MVLFIVVNLILSFSLGSNLLERMKLKQSFSHAILLGFLAFLSIYEILYIICIVFSVQFTILTSIYVVMSAIIFLISIKITFKNFKYLKNKLLLKVHNLSTKEKIIWLVAILIILYQLMSIFIYAHYDDDDGTYVAIATTTISSNNLASLNPVNGMNAYDSISMLLVGYETWLASYAVVLNTHPAILFHISMNVFVVVLSYLALNMLARQLFKGNACVLQQALFILFMALLFFFSGYSVFTQGSFLMLRAWQGKCIYINVIIPYLFYIYLKIIDDTIHINKYIMLFIFIVISSVAVSPMGLNFSPLLYIVLFITLLFSIKQKIESWAFLKYLAITIFVFSLVALGMLYLYSDVFFEMMSYKNNPDLYMQVWKNYIAKGYIIYIYIIALFYFALKKGISQTQKQIFLYIPIVLFITFLNPLFCNFISSFITHPDIYWRLIWFLPIYYTIACFFSEIVVNTSMVRYILNVALCILIIVVSGKFIVTPSNFSKVGNFYKLPDEVIYFSDKLQAAGYVLLAPTELDAKFRQYDATILMSVTRLESHIEYDTNQQLVVEQSNLNDDIQDNADLKVIDLLGINAIITKANRENKNLSEYGFSFISEMNGYFLYTKSTN